MSEVVEASIHFAVPRRVGQYVHEANRDGLSVEVEPAPAIVGRYFLTRERILGGNGSAGISQETVLQLQHDLFGEVEHNSRSQSCTERSNAILKLIVIVVCEGLVAKAECDLSLNVSVYGRATRVAVYATKDPNIENVSACPCF